MSKKPETEAELRKRIKKPKLEKEVKKKIKKLLDSLGAWHFMPMQTMGQSGIPDHIACFPLVITQDMVGTTVGAFVGIEAKMLGKKPTAMQMHQLGAIDDAGGFAVIIDGMPDEPGSFKITEGLLRGLAKPSD